MKKSKFLEIIKTLLKKFGIASEAVPISNSTSNASEPEQELLSKSKFDNLFEEFFLNGKLSEAQEMIEHGYKINKKLQKVINEEVLTGISKFYFKVPDYYLKPMSFNKIGDREVEFANLLIFILKNELVDISTLEQFKGKNKSFNHTFKKELKESEKIMGSVLVEEQMHALREKFCKEGAGFKSTVTQWSKRDEDCYFLQSCLLDMKNNNDQTNSLSYLKDKELSKFSINYDVILKADKNICVEDKTIENFANSAYRNRHKYWYSDNRYSKIDLACEKFIPDMIKILVDKKGYSPSQVLKNVINSNEKDFNALENVAVILFKEYPLEVLKSINNDELKEFKRILNNYFKLIDRKYNIKENDKNALFSSLDEIEKVTLGKSNSLLLEEFKRQSRKQSFNYLDLAKSLDIPEIILSKLEYIKDRSQYLDGKDISVEDKRFVSNSEKTIEKILNVYKDLLELDESISIKEYLLNPVLQIENHLKNIDNRFQSEQVDSLLDQKKVLRKTM